MLFNIPDGTRQTIERFDSDGKPELLTFDFPTVLHITDTGNYDLAMGFLRGLFLNNSVDPKLVDEDGNFTPDALNLIKLVYSLPEGYDFSQVLNEANASPIAAPRFDPEGESLTDIVLTSASVDPDGRIVAHRWEAYNGDPDDDTFVIINPNSPTAILRSEYPGVITVRHIVTDDRHATNVHERDISIYHQGGSPFKYKAVSFGVYFDPTLPDEYVREHMRALKRDNVGIVSFQPIWWFSDINSNEIFPLYYDGGLEDPRGKTIPDEKLERYIQIAIEEGLDIMLKPHILTIRTNTSGIGRGAIEPRPEFFSAEQGYNNFILHYVNIAERYYSDNGPGVKIFCIGTELSTLNQEDGAPFWRQLASMVRQRFDGLLTYDQHYTNFIDMALENDLVLFPWDCVDLIGVSAYYPLASNTESSIQEMTLEFRTIIDQQLRPCQMKYNKPLIFAECGYANRDGGTIDRNDAGWLPASDYQRDDEEHRRAFAAILIPFPS